MTNIRVIERKGQLPGKTIVILGGVHGNEQCGIQAFEKIMPELKINLGKVIFVYANLAAIKENKRLIETNLNRCFLPEQPSEIKNTLEGKTAKEIMSLMDKADVLLDIHASNTPESLSFIICAEHSFDLARFLPVGTISYNWDSYEQGSTEYYMNLSQKPAIAVECGYLKDLESTNRAVKVIVSFLIATGNIDGEKAERNNQQFYKIVDLYRNKKFSFRKEREFTDFEELKQKTLIGKEGNEPIFVEKGNAVLFVRDREKINQECFLVAKKSVKSKMMTKICRQKKRKKNSPLRGKGLK